MASLSVQNLITLLFILFLFVLIAFSFLLREVPLTFLVKHVLWCWILSFCLSLKVSLLQLWLIAFPGRVFFVVGFSPLNTLNILCHFLWSSELYAPGVLSIWAAWALLLWCADYHGWTPGLLVTRHCLVHRLLAHWCLGLGPGTSGGQVWFLGDWGLRSSYGNWLVGEWGCVPGWLAAWLGVCRDWCQ